MAGKAAVGLITGLESPGGVTAELGERRDGEAGARRGPGWDWRQEATLVRLLRQVPVFRGLSWEVAADVADRLQRHCFPAGQVVAREGDPAPSLHIVESGRVSAARSRDPGMLPAAVYSPGGHFGEAALWLGKSQQTITVVEATVTWSLAAGDIVELRGCHSMLDSAIAGVTPDAPGERSRPPKMAEPGLRIDVIGVAQRVRSGKTLLRDISFSIEPGELVGIVGGSGAGKTTLLDAISGVRPAAEGTVLYDGADYYSNIAAYRSSLGYVPQDDIIHKELPLARTLRYGAKLRMAGVITDQEIDAAVGETMDALDLSERADLPVKSLSGGQRKRASIAVELLTKPRVAFLDEPTSGLDPATGAELMRLLRRISDRGSTVVLTTHTIQDIRICDKVVFLTPGGRLAFVGTPGQSLTYFQAAEFDEIYERLGREATPEVWATRFAVEHPPAGAETGHPTLEPTRAAQPIGRSIGPLRQWAVLTRRNLDILIRNRLTLGILVGSPILVVAMFAILFKPGAFGLAHPSPSATLMIVYWIAFAGFFFGLTYGLLQICTEFPILRRERLVNLRIGPYVMSKVAVLLPLLLIVDVTMLGVLRLLHRLPVASAGVYGQLGVTLLLDGAAALGLGLLTSAAVTRPEQATLALPMICFPQVLFSGAFLAVPVMAAAGRWISYAMSDRWAFEALGKTLNLNLLFQHGASPLGPPLLAQYGDTFSRAVAVDWAILGGFAVLTLAGACYVLAHRCRTAVGSISS
jgi:ABC-type multidrug transport system ATPase subunit